MVQLPDGNSWTWGVGAHVASPRPDEGTHLNNAHDRVTNATVVAALLLVGFAGCADSTSNLPALSNGGTQVTAAAVNGQGSVATLSDGQIVGIVTAVDGAEVGAGISRCRAPRARGSLTVHA